MIKNYWANSINIKTIRSKYVVYKGERGNSKGMFKKYKYKEKITVQEMKIEISSRIKEYVNVNEKCIMTIFLMSSGCYINKQNSFVNLI